MAEHIVTTTDSELDTALLQAKLHDHDTRASSVEHLPDLNLLIVQLNNGRRLVLPLEDIQGLEAASTQQLERRELLGNGTGISFPDLDVDLYVPALLKGIYGNHRWMSLLGKKGGAVKSSAKRRAAQTNGAKGGRPRRTAAA